jgi:hypothetical protein
MDLDNQLFPVRKSDFLSLTVHDFYIAKQNLILNEVSRNETFIYCFTLIPMCYSTF